MVQVSLSYDICLQDEHYAAMLFNLKLCFSLKLPGIWCCHKENDERRSPGFFGVER